MTEQALELRQFGEADFDDLISVVPDAAFVLQWAGPQYVFPLDREQLAATLAKTEGEYPSARMYKAVLPDGESGRFFTVGHVQLLDIDRQYGVCVLGRVLIFPEHRGKGLGVAMVDAALREAFDNLGLKEVMLAVFDFNEPALRTYRGRGFENFDHGEHKFAGEPWGYTRMSLRASEWRRPKRRRFLAWLRGLPAV